LSNDHRVYRRRVEAGAEIGVNLDDQSEKWLQDRETQRSCGQGSLEAYIVYAREIVLDKNFALLWLRHRRICFVIEYFRTTSLAEGHGLHSGGN
jgi:hypothetical protein